MLSAKLRPFCLGLNVLRLKYHLIAYIYIWYLPDDQPPKKKKKKGTDDEEEADLLVKPKKTKNKFKKDKRSKKLASAKSPVFSENPKDDGDDVMEADISGDPFEDSNSTAALVVENGEPASVGAKKKKKKKKNKNLASKDSVVNGAPDSKSDSESSQNDSQIDMDMDSSDIAGDTPPSTKSGKKGKAKSLDSPSEPNKLSKKEKKKRRTLDNSDLVNTKKIENIELDFVQIKDKKKGKSKSHSVDEAMENGGEIEIFIPNKKYKGALKEQFEEKAKEALESEKFASFKKSKTPPAFVKKAFLKANAGSMTDPQKKRKKVSRDHSGYGLGQWETALLYSASSHWPSPYPEWSLGMIYVFLKDTVISRSCKTVYGIFRRVTQVRSLLFCIGGHLIFECHCGTVMHSHSAVLHCALCWPRSPGIFQACTISVHPLWCSEATEWTQINGSMIHHYNHIHFDITVLSVFHSMELARYLHTLTHLPLDKMAAISKTLFSNAFPWMKSLIFWIELHWSFFLRVQLTISQHRFW